MKDELLYARWASEKEVSDFYGYLNSQKKNKNDFTSKWLADHGGDFIDLHSRFFDEYYLHKKNIYLKRLEESIILYHERLSSYNHRKENLDLCPCGSKERIYSYNDYEFIGCPNYKDLNYNHTKIYPPWNPEKNNDSIDEIEHYKPGPQYLSVLKKFYNLPKELKSSILSEFLKMNNIPLLSDVDKIVRVASDASSLSKNRENLVRPILENCFDKVYYQKMIKAKYKYNSKTTFIPDFICVKDDAIYLIEQKKNIDNVNMDQINQYMELISFMINKSEKNYHLKYLIVLEFGETNLEKQIINFKDLQNELI